MLTNLQPISREAIGPLLIQPLAAASVAFTTATVVRTDGATFRVPTVLEDPTAVWLAEGAEIPASDPELGELTVTPKKIAGMVVVSRELASDSSPAAAEVVGLGLARDIARRIDIAFYGSLSSPAPPGLASVSGVQTVVGPVTDIDTYAEAISLAETVGAKISSFAMSPASALSLSTVKEATGSARPLLGTDAVEAGQRRVLGVDVTVSPSIPDGTVWGYDRTRVWTVLRQDVQLDVDGSRYFELDSVAIRATLRCAFAFAHPASIVKVTAA